MRYRSHDLAGAAAKYQSVNLDQRRHLQQSTVRVSPDVAILRGRHAQMLEHGLAPVEVLAGSGNCYDTRLSYAKLIRQHKNSGTPEGSPRIAPARTLDHQVLESVHIPHYPVNVAWDPVERIDH